MEPTPLFLSDRTGCNFFYSPGFSFCQTTSRVLTLALMVLAGPTPYLQRHAEAIQQTSVWGGGNGDWDDPNGTGAFWDPDNPNGPTNGDEPGVTYDVRIDNGNEAANSAVTVDQNVNIDRLEISTLDSLTSLGFLVTVGRAGCRRPLQRQRRRDQ